MKRIVDCRFYAILDTGYCTPDRMPAMAEKMITGGVDVIQLRAKNLSPDRIRTIARQLKPILHDAGIPFIINDHPEIAGELGNGVHVGQDDVPLAEARRRTERNVILGKSTHSVQQAVAAEEECADYIGFGPLFSTPTKPDYTPIGLEDIAAVHRLVRIPIFCIGGIKLENVDKVIQAGARRIVIVSGILQAQDVTQYCREVVARLK